MQNFIILEILDLAHSVLISYSKQNHLQFFMSLSKYKHQDLASVFVELEMSFPKKMLNRMQLQQHSVAPIILPQLFK